MTVLLVGFGSYTPGVLAQASGAPDPCPRTVATSTEVERVLGAQRGYDILATPNQARFFGNVFLELARRYRTRRPAGPPLEIRHDVFFPAVSRVAGVPLDSLPDAFRLPHEHGQTVVIEHRVERVVSRVEEGLVPASALGVRVEWPDTGDAPGHYVFEDTLSEPSMKLRHERVVTFRLLDFGDMVVFAEMEGSSGRPTSGVLGALFRLLGTAGFEESRYAVADDGVHVARVRVRKWFTAVNALATVLPDGRATKGIPDGRPDLEALAERLDRPVSVVFEEDLPGLCEVSHGSGVRDAPGASHPGARPDHPMGEALEGRPVSAGAVPVASEGGAGLRAYREPDR